MDTQSLSDSIQHHKDGLITAYELWEKVGAWHAAQAADVLRDAHEEAFEDEQGYIVEPV